MTMKENVLGVIFTCLQMLVTSFQYYWGKISGISKKIENLKVHGALYNKSDLLVQTFKVITSRHAFGSSPIPVHLSNVVLWHESFQTLERIMYPGVTLYMILDEYIYFAEFDNVDEIFDTRKHPFLYRALEAESIRFHRVHRTALIHLTKDFPTINRKVVWISHVGRCGSTALSQAFNALQNWTVLADLPFVTNSCPMSATSFEDAVSFYASSEFIETVVAAIRFQLQMIPESQNICCKLYNRSSAYLLPIISKAFPDHKLIFMNRSIIKVVDSFSSQVGQTWYENRIATEIKKNRNYMGVVNGVLNVASREFWSDDSPTIYHRYYSGTITLLYVLRELCSSVPMMYIDYQAFMSDLEKHLKHVFEYTEVSLTQLDAALQSYKTDSQAGSFLSRTRLANKPPYIREERVVEKCDQFGKALGFPDIHQDLTRDDLKLTKAVYIIADDKE